MRLAITGATGSLGGALITAVAEDGRVERLVALSRDEVKSGDLADRWAGLPYLRCVLGDVRDRERLEQVFRGCDAVVHAAALKRVSQSVYSPSELIETNVVGTMRVIRAAAAVGVRRVLVVSSDKACLDWFSPVRLADGTTARIAALVKRRFSGLVRTLCEDGTIGVARVVGWHKTRRAGREMMRVSCEGAHRHRGRSGGVVCTADHRILTPRGWTSAGDLRSGDDLVTSEPGPGGRRAGLLAGMLLGDGHITRARRPVVICSQADDQRDWCEVKRAALAPLGVSALRTYPSRGRRQGGTVWSTVASAWAAEWRRAWYEPRKRVPRKLVAECWSAELLAAWYLDDGTLSGANARISTADFSFADAGWLVDRLRADGIDARVCRCPRRGPIEIRFSVDGTVVLHRRIGRFVPPSLRYKLVDGAPPYDPRAWDLGPASGRIARAVVERVTVRARDVYCLDVEGTHNFTVGDVVVHNCEPCNLYGMTKAVAECYAVQANSYTYPQGTRVACVRYGNVLGSRGSVVEVWRGQVARGVPLTITEPAMTRFVLTLPQAAAFCLAALADMDGGEIFVPRLPAATVATLAKAVWVWAGHGDDWRHNPVVYPRTAITGLRPGGEKLHESLLTREEPARTWRAGRDRMVVLPSHHSWREAWALPEGERVPAPYTSDRPDRWLDVPALTEMLKEVPR